MLPNRDEITAALTHLNDNFGTGDINAIQTPTDEAYATIDRLPRAVDGFIGEYTRRIPITTQATYCYEICRYRVKGRDVYACGHCKRVPPRNPTRAEREANPGKTTKELAYSPKPNRKYKPKSQRKCNQPPKSDRSRPEYYDPNYGRFI